MIHMTVSCAGKLKEPYWEAAVREYEKRLSGFCKLKIAEVPENKPLLVPPKDYLVALCVEGETLTSPALAQRLQGWQSTGVSSVCFLIGGSDGLPEELKDRADQRLSMSAMTWTHAMARVMLLEQLYRGFTIINGMKYHK